LINGKILSRIYILSKEGKIMIFRLKNLLLTTTRFCVVLLLCLILLSTIAFGQNMRTDLWKNLKPGVYSVGYKLIHKYDYGRTFKPKYDYEGNHIDAENARPVQISVWYPAAVDDRPEFMKYEEYIYSLATEIEFGQLNEEKKQETIRRFKAFPLRNGADEAELDKILTSETYAVKDADQNPGSFPLILYASGGGGSSYENSVLFEYLASNGYIIAAIPSVGQYKRTGAAGSISLDAQGRDMEFMLGEMVNFPNVNIKKIGTLGFSRGGSTNVLLAMRNFNIDAVVSLDGGTAIKRGIPAVKSSPYYNPDNMRAAFMYIGQRPNENQDFSFYNSLKYSDAYLLLLHDMGHIGFTSSVIKVALHTNARVENLNRDRVDTGYGTVCRYVLQFFNAHLNKSKEGLAFLRNSPEANGIPEDVVSKEFRKGHTPPPTEEQFFDIVRSGEIEKAVKIFKKAREIDPEVTVFEENRMNALGYEVLRSRRLEDALELFKLNILAFPESWNVYDSMGEAFGYANRLELAIENYRKSLKLNPENEHAIREISRLQGTIADNRAETKEHSRFEQGENTGLKGMYLGQSPPGLEPKLFAPGIVSTGGNFEFGCTFSPDGKEFYFTRRKDDGGRNTIMVSRMEEKDWTAPETAPFSGEYFDFEPHISPDGKKFFYGTSRPVPGATEQNSTAELWVMERTGDGWGNHKYIGPGMYVTSSLDGTIYYFCGQGVGKSLFVDGEYTEPEVLGGEVNSPVWGIHACIAPDGSFIIFDSTRPGGQGGEGDFYICFRNEDGSWGKAINLGDKVNTPGINICPSLSHDGKYLFYNAKRDIYWVSTELFKTLNE